MREGKTDHYRKEYREKLEPRHLLLAPLHPRPWSTNSVRLIKKADCFHWFGAGEGLHWFFRNHPAPEMSIQVIQTGLDFSPLHERMQWYVAEKQIPFVLTAVMKGHDIIDLYTCGNLSMESDVPLSTDSIFRMHSCTKIACSIAAMMLWEEGRFSLDDPVEKYIPAFADMMVLKPGAESMDDIEPANDSMRVNQLLSHTSGLSYGFVQPDTLIDQHYLSNGLNALALTPGMTLETLCDALGHTPLAYQPGTSWRYSFATDVTARLVEVVSGQRFDEFLKERILNPLDMVDTDFFVPPEKLDRFTTLYLPADLMDESSPCAAPMDAPQTTANGAIPDFISGGAGLMSTFEDFLTFTRMIINEGTHAGKSLIKPETLKTMRTNQCAEGVTVQFPGRSWNMPGTTFGLGFALKGEPDEGEPASAIGEYHWGGIAGTHYWWSPQAGITGICMTQRMPGFFHPFSRDFKRLAYQIAG
jgi:CubicO group peptidase (beta-lactamase class C family)